MHQVNYLLIVDVTQHAISQEAPRVTRKDLIVSVNTIVYPTCSKHNDKGANEWKDSILNFVWRMVLPAEEVPYCDIEACSNERMTRRITVLKAATIRSEVSNKEGACLVIQAFQEATEGLTYDCSEKDNEGFRIIQHMIREVYQHTNHVLISEFANDGG